jgi:APA family basic amino acid/polyamine antiporter
MSAVDRPGSAALDRRLGTADAVVVGLGAMVGAGVFSVLAPAAQAAGSLLLAGLAVAAVVATCNGLSSAALAAVHPESGGTYVSGRRQLGPAWGAAAGTAFVVGKTASCAAMALTVGAYAAPSAARPVAVAAVVALAAANLRGVASTARLARVLLAAVLGVLALVVTAALLAGDPDPAALRPPADVGLRDVLQSAGLLFFAFAGYARISTLGGEVRDPVRTIPRAVRLALGGALAVYLAVCVSALLAVGAPALAGSTAPLSTVVRSTTWSAAEPVVQGGGAIAALGVLLSLLAGVSRTVWAMARGGDLPSGLGAVSQRTRVPWRAELLVAGAVVVLVLVVDLREAIGFSSFAVLGYYAVTNAAALTLTAGQRRLPRAVPVAGLAGCVVLATALPLPAVVAGSAVLAAGALVHVLLRRR